MDWITIAESVALAVGVTAGLYLGYKEFREYKIRRRVGLEANPTRCERQDERIRAVENSCSNLTVRLTGIEDDLRDVKAGVNRLIDIHLKT